ncbi:MAG: helix-turn-helix domain-containing protein [Rubrobacter sp.]
MLEELQLSRPISAGVATYPAGATFGPRAMRDFEFVWVIEGDTEYGRDGVTVPAPPGSVLLCRPGGTDFFRWDPDRRTRHGYFHFGIQALPSGWPPPESWPLVRPPVEGDVLRPLFRHLLTWADRGDPLLIHTTMAHMLTSFVTGEIAGRDVPRETMPEAVERAWKHIHDRMEEDPSASITLGDLADAACVSPEHLCRLFKRSTARSPVETVRLARLDRAAVLLARSNYSVAEIAGVCGFSSPFHFSRRFKDAFGESPRNLRQSLARGATPPTPRLLRPAGR